MDETEACAERVQKSVIQCTSDRREKGDEICGEERWTVVDQEKGWVDEGRVL